MQTEDLVLQLRRPDPLDLSPALRDRVPSEWHLVDARGRPVPLSTAGCVLYFGRKYQVRVAAVQRAPEAPPDLHVVSWPAFLRREPSLHTETRHGRTYRCLSFHVNWPSRWLRPFKAPYEIFWGEIEIDCIFPDEREPQRLKLEVPVVARTAWSIGIVLLLIGGALLGWLAGQAQSALAELTRHGRLAPSGFEDWWLSLQGNPHFWVWPLVLAGLNPVLACACNAWLLRQRAHELESSYHREHDPLPLTTTIPQ